MKGRIPLAEAQRVAWDWTRTLAPDCARIEVAGSIRRKRETIGDVEIVAIPTPGEPEQVALLPGLTGTEKQKLPPLFERIHDLSNSRNGSAPIVVTKGAPGLLNGRARYLQIHDKNEDLYVDLFLASPDTWGVIFAIRTGSADFSHGLMIRANQRGMTSCKGRLVLKGEVFHDDKGATKVVSLPELLKTPEERDVFEALRIEWVEPPLRRGTDDIKALPSTLRSPASSGTEDGS